MASMRHTAERRNTSAAGEQWDLIASPTLHSAAFRLQHIGKPLRAACQARHAAMLARNATVCAGPVPQQLPMMRAPRFNQSSAWRA